MQQQYSFKNRRSRSWSSHRRKSSGYGSNSGSYSNSYSRSNFSKRGSFGDTYISHDKYISQATEVEVPSIYNETIAFTDFPFHNRLKENISDRNFTNPTNIQADVIKHILAGRDVIGLASTGSGKTAAFLLPMINIMLNNPSKKCLIIAPTRELANQIQVEFRSFSKNTSLLNALITGGASYYDQLRHIRRNPHIVIATPGRLMDLYKQNHIDLSAFDHIILDEVDQMLDMGFLNDIKFIISKLKTPRQSLFFSATMSPKIREVATSLLNNPVVVEVQKQSPTKNVDQNIVRVGGSSNKFDVLHELLIQEDFEKVLIFSRTKRGSDDVAKKLKEKGHKCEALHGDKTLGQRKRTLRMFRENEITILVATDVASRGIDVPNITHVINYDEPATYEDYIHRIGRTGRIGKKGTALTFVK